MKIDVTLGTIGLYFQFFQSKTRGYRRLIKKCRTL